MMSYGESRRVDYTQAYGESRRVDYTQAVILKIPYIPTYLHSYIPTFLPFAISTKIRRGSKQEKNFFKKFYHLSKQPFIANPPLRHFTISTTARRSKGNTEGYDPSEPRQ
jgi:hypothetical protein